MTGFATLRIQFGYKVIRVFAFNVIAARTVTDFAARIRQMGGFLN